MDCSGLGQLTNLVGQHVWRPSVSPSGSCTRHRCRVRPLLAGHLSVAETAPMATATSPGSSSVPSARSTPVTFRAVSVSFRT